MYYYSSSRIRDFDVQARNCLFEDERDEPNSQVTMFKHYSEENCLLECRAKHLMDKCGCLPYYYPNFENVWKTKTTCNLTGKNSINTNL